MSVFRVLSNTTSLAESQYGQEFACGGCDSGFFSSAIGEIIA